MSHFDHFDFLAPLYDRLLKPADPERMSSIANLPSTGYLLDAGGGTGRSSYELTGLVEGVVIADSSMGMLNQATSKGRFTTVCSYSEDMPFISESFERVIMVDALHHVKDYHITINELWRVVKPGGLIIVEEPDIHKFPIKLMALFEKLLFMRSHFISPERIKEKFSFPNAIVEIKTEGTTAWIIIKKGVA